MFDLIEKIYVEMQSGFRKVDERINKVDERLDKIENTVVKIENEHGEKLQALFDGYKQNTDNYQKYN
ncbi:hypothetical protein [Clostridium sp. DL1XJH146]